MSSFFLAGLDEPRERRCLAACMALCTAYVAIFLAFSVTGTRIDTAFFARRQAILLRHLEHDRMPLGAQVVVSDHGHIADRFALLGGWSALEPWGIWSDGPDADFAVALPASGAADMAIQIWATIHAPPAGAQQIALLAEDRPLGTWHLGAGQALLCATLPSAQAARGKALRLRFEVAQPGAPPGGLDARRLGVGLESVEILGSASGCAANAALPDAASRPGK